MAASQDKYQHKASDYEYSKFGLTRNFLKTTLYQPHLKKGILMLVKARMNILIPTTTKEYETNMTIQKPICPLCKEQRKNDVLGEESEIAHILINCKSLIEKRDKHLTNIIQKLTRGVKQKNDISITTAEEKVAELLLGGECKSYLPHKDKQIEMMETRGIDEGFLLSWQWGYGQFTGYQPDNMTLYGFVPVARFWMESFGWYQEALDRTREATNVATNNGVRGYAGSRGQHTVSYPLMYVPRD